MWHIHTTRHLKEMEMRLIDKGYDKGFPAGVDWERNRQKMCVYFPQVSNQQSPSVASPLYWFTVQAQLREIFEKEG